MNESIDLELERRLQDLLCGELDEEQTRSALARIVTDARARQVLEEMLAVQRLSRAAFGLDRAEGLARRVRAGPSESRWQGLGAASLARGGPARRFPAGWFAWTWRVAAALVLAATVGISLWSHQNNRDLRRRLENTDRTVAAMADVTGEELTRYRRIWSETVSPGEKTQPWILIHNENARFEYPAASEDGAGRPLVLVRCLLVSAEGKEVERISLLLPQERRVQLALGESSGLGGGPLRCEVVSEGRGVGVDLRLGLGGADSVGVQGRVALGEKPAEVGRFRLGHQDLRVYLQAMPFLGA